MWGQQQNRVSNAWPGATGTQPHDLAPKDAATPARRAGRGVTAGSWPQAAQGDREQRFKADAATALHRNAQSWFKVGFVLRAKRIWREVVTEYDVDHEPSWNALGYMRFGVTWAPDESRPYPLADSAAPSRRRSLQKKWDTLARNLGQGHRKLALALADDGSAKRSRYHAQRALRFLPRDAAARRVAGVATRSTASMVSRPSWCYSSVRGNCVMR